MRIPIFVFLRTFLWISMLASLTVNPAAHAQDLSDSIVISEIMYHPYHSATTPEDLKQEWIELFNRGTSSINLAGWSFSDGVSFTFPNVTLGAGRYLVVAADVAAFSAKHPGVANAVGGWTGWLSNSGERLKIVDDMGEVIDSVKYADEGDWAVRELGPVDNGHRGWQWSDAHDGGGKSLELVNPALPNEYGPNWAASLVEGGTPGAPGIIPVTDTAPLIVDVGHRPIVPGPGDAVTVTARIIDELKTGLVVTLYYRLDSSTYTNQNTYPRFNPADYRSVPMYDDGSHDDKRAGDGVFGGQIPAQPNGRIVEFYVEARGSGGKARTWPAPSMIDNVPQQVTNALYQVDNSFDPTWTLGGFPRYYIIMTEMERGRLAYIGNHSNLSGPNAQMNATFISLDGTGMELRYNAGIRNRGHGTRNGPPNNQHVAFPSDRTWNGRNALNFNCRNTPGQIMGSAIFRMAGFVAPYTTPAQLRINGTNLATTGGPMYGVYARLDAFDSVFAEQYFPSDPNGNLYACFRDNGETDFRYEGTNPSVYRNRYYKESNASQDDWSDIIHLTDVLNNAPEVTYFQEVSKVINVRQWLRYIALDSLLMNNETGLNRGIGDDFFMYRGITDPRFVLMPHDLDTILDQGGGPNFSIFSIVRGASGANGVDGLRRFFNHPDVIPLYHQAMLDVMEGFFNPETLDPLFDQILGGFAPAARISAMKQIIRQRIAAVLAQIPQTLTITGTLPVVNGYPRTTTRGYSISGTANAAKTRSVLINGTPAAWTAQEGTWRSGGTEGPAESLIAVGSEWKFLDDGSNQGTAWRAPGFDDSAWRSGKAELGYGDGDEATVVNSGPTSSRYITTYFRKSFTASSVAYYATLRVRLLRDDGAVIYLNGVEACRSGMPGGQITYTTLASASLGGADESSFVEYDALPTLLREGTNTIAVEIHQAAASSSDISFNLALDASRRGAEEETLLPGINRIVVQAFDSRGGAGNKVEEGYIDIWYDDGSTSELSGTVASNRVLDAASGPWLVTGNVTIPAGVTLTIEPGTTLFFNPNTSLVVSGRLVAEGTEYRTITFTKAPGSTSWAGLQFLNAQSESRLVYVNMEYCDSGSTAVRANHAQVYLDHVVWGHHAKQYLTFDDSSIILKNSVLPSIQGTELVHLWTLPQNGRALFEGNWFGSTTGYNDIVDFTGAKRPGAIGRFINNTFSGASDDCLDLDSADAHVEGNIFLHVHADATNSSPSHAIATGTENGQSSEVTAVRNLFYDVDHAFLTKNGGFITAVNNTAVHTTKAVVNVYEPGAGNWQGRGFYGDGNIFHDAAHVFENPDWVGHSTAITMNNSIFSKIAGDPVVWTGVGNLEDMDPQLLKATDIIDPPSDMRLLAGSPAVGAGPNGRDMGGLVPPGASISGEPLPATWRTRATLTVGGPDIYAYKYRVNNGPWSAEISRPDAILVSNPKPLPPIELTSLQNGQSYTVYVIAKDSAGVWQSENSPTISRSWLVDTSYQYLAINEFLASNQSVLERGGKFPDMVELYYDGPASLSLSGMSLTDDPDRPTRFVFPANVTMSPGQYLVVYADDATATSGLHLGFRLDADGDALYLYDKAGLLLDSVEFGAQLPDLSVGRVGGQGQWHLTVPTFGQANLSHPLGDPRAVKINEWLATGDVLFGSDFVELYNPGPLPVGLGGFYVTNTSETEPDRHRLRPLTFVAGEGFVTFTADNKVEPGHLGFKLLPDGDIISFYDAAYTQIDKVMFAAQATDVSQGRSPDGSSRFEYFILPTPGLPNAVTPQATTTAFGLVPEGAPKRAIVPTSASHVAESWKSSTTFDDSKWLSSVSPPGGVGFERGAGYEHLISLNVETSMYGRNGTCYIRIPFRVEGNPAATLSELNLSVRYDDGFIAYLNGVEVARTNFNGTPQWNSVASTNYEANGQRFDAVLNISDRIGLLRRGDNLLAIQGLNSSTTSSDFIISAALDAKTVDTAGEYPYVRELQLLDGLRITELMYNAAKGSDLDYLELQNVGGEALDLTGVRFTSGIDFVFSTVVLMPGQRTVVAGNLAAFRANYGTDISVAGAYSGRLSDGGEEIVLKLPSPMEAAIMRFEYSDVWYPATDGGGESLTIKDPTAPAVTWNDSESWRSAPPTPGKP